MSRQTAAEARIDDLAARYVEIANLIDSAEQTKNTLGAEIKAWLLESGESVLDIEGLPLLKLKTRSTATVYDAAAYAEQCPDEYKRLLERGGVSLVKSVADALAGAGQLTTQYRRFGHSGESDPFIVREKR